jgi:hypothetical protein
MPRLPIQEELFVSVRPKNRSLHSDKRILGAKRDSARTSDLRIGPGAPQCVDGGALGTMNSEGR